MGNHHQFICGIILAGGRGTRLGSCTRSVSKQLLPVYDKPMIYYPLSFLMKAHVQDIAIITTPEDQAAYMKLLGSGEDLGVNFTYIVQEEPRGLAEAYILARDFIRQHGRPRRSVMVLGDNIFYGHQFDHLARTIQTLTMVPTIVGYPVSDPRSYGVVQIATGGEAIGVEEKPTNPKSKYAIPGLYCFDEEASEIAAELTPSARGELEITGLMDHYIKHGAYGLRVQKFEETNFWFDAGTPDGLLDASNFVAATQRRLGKAICNPADCLFKV